MIRQPISRQDLDVALSERFRSHRVIPIRAAFTTRIRWVLFDLRSAQRLKVSQKKKRPLNKQRTPRLFLPPVIPRIIERPVQGSYPTPISRKYLITTTESGISK